MRPPSKNDNWCTPPDLWRRGLLFFGVFTFDFDPCTNRGSTVPATVKWNKRNNGLRKPWKGCAWINPPYSHIEPWAKLGYETWKAGDTETLHVVPNATGTKYWHAYYWRASFICFVGPGRVSFCDFKHRPHNSNNKESAIVGFVRPGRESHRRFRAAFGDIGKVVKL